MGSALAIQEVKRSSIVEAGPPIFIVGSARSGTTLLYHMLLSSGGFAKLFGEPAVFDVLAPHFGNLSELRNRERLLRHWIGGKTHTASGLPAASLRETLLRECNSNADFLRVLMREVAANQGVPRWAVWGPDNLLYLRTIKAQMPDARFIHMVRDGRDVAVSMNRERFIRPLQGDAKDSLLVAGLHWQWKVRAGREQACGFGSDYLEVRFENLLTQPQRELDKVSKLVEYPLDYAQLQETPVGSFARTNSSFVAVDQELARRPVRRWESQLTREEVEQLEACIGDTLEEFGYARATLG